MTKRRFLVSAALLFVLAGCGGGSEPLATEKPQAVPAGAPPVYRLVRLATGTYFYTTSTIERDNAVLNYGFQDEGGKYRVAPPGTGIPVYRFANTVNSSYFYTVSVAVRDNIIQTQPFMRYEGSHFEVPATANNDTKTVYMLGDVDTGAYYFYTSNLAEKAYALLSGDWRDEGIAFEAYPL